MRDEAANEKTADIRFVKMPVHFKLFCHKNRKFAFKSSFYAFSGGQSSAAEYLHPSSSHTSQELKHETTKACIALCCKHVRSSDTMISSGFVDYSQTLIKTGSLHGIWMLKIRYHNPPQYPVIQRSKLKNWVINWLPENAVHQRNCVLMTANTYPERH